MPLLVRLLAQGRLRLARSPWLYWALVGCSAFVVWWVVVDATTSLERERSRWGATRTVLVTAAATEAGADLVAEVRHYPRAMVPTAALDGDSPLAPGARARHDLAAGTVLTNVDIATTDAPPSDWVTVALDATHQPPLVPGDAVAVFAMAQYWCDGAVADIDPLQVAMPTECAAAISDGSTLGAVTLGRRN